MFDGQLLGGHLLEVHGLTKAFGGVRAVEDFNLALGEGAMLAVIGPNGCGKTTFFNLLTGQLAPDQGRIAFDGEEIGGQKPYRIARRGIARKFQVPGIYPGLGLRENLEIAFASAPARRGLRGLWARRRGWRNREAEILAAVGLAAKADWLAGTLSHGEKQWLEIAMVMASGPRLLLLDEPTAGMTGAEAKATAGLIRGLNRDTGVAAIVIEHDMTFVETLGCEIAVMMKGRIARRGLYRDLSADPLVREAYLGPVEGDAA